MEIKNFIKIYDQVLPWNVLSNLIRFANVSEFEQTRIGGGKQDRVDFNVRRTFTFPLSNIKNSLSAVHWFNLLGYFFYSKLKQYQKDANILDYDYKEIFDIEILKYENTGFYTWHVDHFATVPRTMSCILL